MTSAIQSRGQLPWERLESLLTAPARRGARTHEDVRELERLFDEREIAQLRRIAAHARLVRSRGAVLGNVIFLHGIAGADLSTIDRRGKREGIWISVLGIMRGGIERLQLDEKGTHAYMPAYRVETTGINQSYYARAILTLRSRWNTVGFAYDWRRDLDVAADELAAFIRAQFAGKPVHLVAHSMGGLVARNFIRRHPRLWQSMRDGRAIAGGRLIMLGTPNHGSFAIAQALTGEDSLMNLLTRFDMRHDRSQLLNITNSFAGMYQLLPAPSKLAPALKALYQKETWGETPGISQRHLQRAYNFHCDLDESGTIDPERMLYVAGCGHATIEGMSIVGPADFEFHLSSDGDGRVSHTMGLLNDVPTYYIDEAHGDLARNAAVLAAVDELLETGRTANLGASVLRRAARALPTMRQYRADVEGMLMQEVERITLLPRNGGRAPRMTGADQRFATDALLRAALGGGAADGRQMMAPTRRRAAAKPLRERSRIPLRVKLRWGDITTTRSPMVVVGHYRGVPPVNAIGALDRKLGGWIALAVKQGMIGGSLGETFLIPTQGRLTAQSVTVAGMGDAGEFTYESLRTLMANVAIGAAGLGLKGLATVLVGWGEGNLDADSALRGQLEGIAIGLEQLRTDRPQVKPRLREVVIVEINARKFLDLTRCLYELAQADAVSGIALEFSPPSTRMIVEAQRQQSNAGGRRRAARAASPSVLEEVRLTVEQVRSAGDVLRFSALTQKSVVPVREVTVNASFVQSAAETLRNAATRRDQDKYGRFLYTYLMPEEFHEYIDGDLPLRLIVDRATAGLPWEMACFPSRKARGQLRRLGLDLRLSRQFRTLLSQPPGLTPALNNRLRVLVIGDPAAEPELRLPGARAEARRVVELLRRKRDGGVEIDVESRIGAGECDPVEILALLISDDFDIVHYAGHGDYDPRLPETAGWVFGARKLLNAADIFRARKVPRLVFANACFSGVLHAGKAFAADELSRVSATIAQAFFERGVRNYIGAGWPVADHPAALLAEEFYERLMQRETISRALLGARLKVFEEEGGNSTWGAYQHYGDPNETVMR